MPDYSNKRVMIVDDVKAMRTVLRTILTKLGFTKIIECEDGQQACSHLEVKYDLIVCDWNMPNMNGLEFLKHTRKDEINKEVPFLIVTTEAEMDNLKQAIAAGVNGYIKKPFKPQTLSEKLEQIMK